MHAEQTRKSVIESILNRDKKQAHARGLGFNKPEVAQAFINEYRKGLVHVDTSLLPMPERALRKLTGHHQDAKK